MICLNPCVLLVSKLIFDLCSAPYPSVFGLPDPDPSFRGLDPAQDPDPLVRGMDPRIRIHSNMPWICNTAFWYYFSVFFLNSCGGGHVLVFVFVMGKTSSI